MPSPPSPTEICAELVSPFQCFTVAMFQPVWADLPVVDRQPTGAKGTQIVSTLPNIRQIAFLSTIAPSDTLLTSLAFPFLKVLAIKSHLSYITKKVI